MIKIITGYRKDQAFSVPMEETHKAYYLFGHPDTRVIFSDGLAVKGSDIDRIEPDLQAAMGWNPTHTIDSDDMAEIRAKGVDRKVRALMAAASDIAKICSESELSLSLTKLIEKYPQLSASEGERGGGFKRLGESTNQ